jgi:hypothetical protein
MLVNNFGKPVAHFPSLSRVLSTKRTDNRKTVWLDFKSSDWKHIKQKGAGKKIMFRKAELRSIAVKSKQDSNKDSREPISPKNDLNIQKLQKRNLMFTPGGNSNLSDNLKKFNENNANNAKENTYASSSSASTRSLTGEIDTSVKSTEKDAAISPYDWSFSHLDVGTKREHDDLSQKGDEIGIEHFEPEPLMFRDCRVASVRDFEALADKLNHALRSRKSPERVYRVLYFLLREDEAIKKLEDAFKQKDGRSLEDALTNHFGEGTPQLKFALELLGKAEANADQTIHKRPDSREECMFLSKHIHNALLQGDFMTVYRALTPFQRNTASLYRLNDWYKFCKKRTLNSASQVDITVTGLQADIKQYLQGKGDSLKFALFLIGDRAMETKVISLSEAERLAKVALEQTFEDNNGKRIRVPHEYTYDECMSRAHIISEAFKELGYGVEKIVAYYKYIDKHGKIRDGLVNPDNPERRWQFHIACYMPVQTDTGIEIRIFDRSGDLDKPKQLWTIEEWIKQVGQDPNSCEITTFENWQRKVEKQCKQDPKNPDPTDLPYVFAVSRNHMCYPDAYTLEEAPQHKDIPDQYSHLVYEEERKDFLIDATKSAPYHRINYCLRNEMQDKTIRDDQDAQIFLDTISTKFEARKKAFHLEEALSTRFSSLFPDTYHHFITHLRESGISSTTIERFEKYLFSYHEEPNKPSPNEKMRTPSWLLEKACCCIRPNPQTEEIDTSEM